MVNFAVVKTGGKQYLVKENDVLTVDLIDKKEKEMIDLPVLAFFDEEGKNIEIGTPYLGKKVKAEVLSSGKGRKIRVSKFKSKVRQRKVMGFRASLTKLKIGKV